MQKWWRQHLKDVLQTCKLKQETTNNE